MLGEDARRYSDAPFDLTPPTAPILAVTGTSTATSITVQVIGPSVDSRHPVVAYVFEYRTLAEQQAELPWTVLTAIGANQAHSGFDIANLQPATTYFFRAKGQDSSVSQNQSAYSLSVSGATQSASAGESWWPNWPIMNTATLQGGASTHLLDPTTHDMMADMDLIIIQNFYPSTSRLTSRVANINAVRALQTAPMNTKFILYTSYQQHLKDEDLTGQSGMEINRDLPHDPVEGNTNWDLTRASNGAQIEAPFNPTSFWLNNIAPGAGENSLGETYAQALWRVWSELLEGSSTETNVLDVIDGFFQDDVHCRMQTPMSVNNGVTTVTDPDFDNDGTANTPTNDFTNPTGASWRWCQGLLDSKDAVEAQNPGFLWLPNQSNGFASAYFDGGGQPPLPLANHPFYHKLEVGFRESNNNAFGISKGSGYTINGGSLFHTCRLAAITLAFLKPDSQNTITGKSCVLFHVNTIDRTQNQDDYELARLTLGVALLHERLCPSISRNGNRPMTLDETLLELGAPLSPRSMGTLNENNVGFSLRDPDQENGVADFFWAEFEKGIVIVRGDHPPVGPWPNTGAAVNVALPSAGTGKVWRMINAASYTNPITGRSMRNQSPLINNGQIVTSLSMRPLTARIVRRVDA